MRLLLLIVAGLALAWSGYWMAGARGVERGLTGWLDDRAAAGWVANYAGVETRGYPNRFDTTVTALELADPATGVAWSAPFFQILRLSYEPNHLIAVWPETQTIASPHQRVTVGTGRARASLVFVPGTDHALDRLTAVFEDVALASNAGWTATLDEARLATRQTAAVRNSVDVGFEAIALEPGGTTLARLADAGLLPGTFERLKIDARLDFDAPWDARAVEARRPAITAIELELLQAKWGKLDLWMAGEVTLDAEGRATGSITVKARNWREMLALGVAAGWIPESIAPTLESGLEILASLSGSPRTLDAPLDFDRGKVSFGPIPLGEAPRIRLR